MGKNLSIAGVILVAILMETGLWNMWQADKAYAMGKNLDGARQYVNAYTYLTQAVEANPGEPTYRDELSYNQAVLASALFTQINNATASAIASLSAGEKLTLKIPQLDASVNDLIGRAVSNSDQVVAASPDSLPFWKNRTKIFYQLAAIDPKYYSQALEALKTATNLAPTDAKVWYNYGLLLGRLEQREEAIQVLQKTIQMKPDYTDAKTTLSEFEKELNAKK